MLKYILQRGIRMAKEFKDAAKKRLRELPRVQLIPVVDPSSDSILRKKEVQFILSMMFANLHKRGRPKKDDNEEMSHAA